MVLTFTSKRQNHKADFFQIMCASQKVWTLLILHSNPKSLVMAYFASEKVCFKAKIYIFQTFMFIKF